MSQKGPTELQTTDARCVVQVVPFCDRNDHGRLHGALNGGARRLYAAVEPLSDYYVETLAAGPIAAVESGSVRLAPVGSLLLRDSDDGLRGILVAKRQPDGWLLHAGAASC